MPKRLKKKAARKTVKTSKWLFWAPRILSILFILFISLFSLLDVFDKSNNYTFWQTMLALFMHLLFPGLLFLIFLWVAWRWDLVGGIAFTLFGLWYIMDMAGFPLSSYVLIAGPAFIIGILFIINWVAKDKG